MKQSGFSEHSAPIKQIPGLFPTMRNASQKLSQFSRNNESKVTQDKAPSARREWNADFQSHFAIHDGEQQAKEGGLVVTVSSCSGKFVLKYSM